MLMNSVIRRLYTVELSVYDIDASYCVQLKQYFVIRLRRTVKVERVGTSAASNVYKIQVLQRVDGQGLLHGTSRGMSRASALPRRTVIRATVTGRLNRRGPALPGLRRNTEPACSIFGTCV